MSSNAMSGMSSNVNVPFTAGTQCSSAAVVPLRVGVWNALRAVDSIEESAEQCWNLVKAMEEATYSEKSGINCAAGICECPGSPRPNFCPVGLLQPRTAADLYDEDSLERDISVLWGWSLQDFVDASGRSVKNTINSHGTSIGAMLGALHPGGHTCLSYAIYYLTGCKLPHEIQTLSGAASYLRRCRYRSVESRARIARLHVSIGDVTSEHVVLVPNVLEVGVYNAREPVLRVSMTLRVYQSIPKACEHDEVTPVSCWGGHPGGVGCCSKLPSDTMYCDDCHVIVTEEGHRARCRKVTAVDETEVMGVALRRAQLGDCYHRVDVLVAMMHRQVPDDKRTHEVGLKVAGTAQATYMRGVGHDGPDRVLSTWFEAFYPKFRRAYLRAVFPDVPAMLFPVVPDFDDMPFDDGVLVYTGPAVHVPSGWDGVYDELVRNDKFASLDSMAFVRGVDTLEESGCGIDDLMNSAGPRSFQRDGRVTSGKRRSATVEADRVEVRQQIRTAKANGDSAGVVAATRHLRRLNKEYNNSLMLEESFIC